MSQPSKQWILAFDASCGTCRTMAGAIASASDARLEVLPLSQPDVARWRSEALGADAPAAPTLLRVSTKSVDAWTGTAMALRLARRLGPASTLRVLSVLGQLRRTERAAVGDEGAARERSLLDRAQFFRLGAGAIMAGGLILAGRVPAFGATDNAELRSWLQANENSLPVRYDEIVARPIAYRRAIFIRSSPEVQKALWLEHLTRHVEQSPELNERQLAAVDSARELLATGTVFGDTDGASPATRQRLAEVKQSTIDAFGVDKARLLLTVLGPADFAPAGDCNCCTWDDWCTGGYVCRVCCDSNRGCACGSNCCCAVTVRGCGSLWAASCNGICEY